MRRSRCGRVVERVMEWKWGLNLREDVRRERRRTTMPTRCSTTRCNIVESE